MALLWIDGFDHYGTLPTTNIAASVVGAYETSSVTWTFLTTMPTLGSGCIAIGPNNTAWTASVAPVYRALPSVYTTGTIGIGFHFVTTSFGSTNLWSMLGFCSSTNVLLYHIAVASAGNLELRSGTGTGTLVATSTQQIAINTLYHIEAEIVIAGSLGGSIQVRVNGQTWINATGITTNGTGINKVGFCHAQRSGATAGISGSRYYDNLYIYDATGSVNNTWLGERNVFTLRPDADTADADWALSTGTDGYDLLDDTPPAPLTNYIESTIAGDLSVFGVEDLPSTQVSIIGVQVVAQALKTGTADTEIEIGVVSDGVTSASAGIPLTQDSSRYFSFIVENDPNTAAPWLPADANAVQLSVERSL